MIMNNVNLGESFEKMKAGDSGSLASAITKLSNNNLFEQVAQITKASAYDALLKRNLELQAKIDQMKIELDEWRQEYSS